VNSDPITGFFGILEFGSYLMDMWFEVFNIYMLGVGLLELEKSL
jgi:hypothetical protein